MGEELVFLSDVKSGISTAHQASLTTSQVTQTGTGVEEEKKKSKLGRKGKGGWKGWLQEALKKDINVFRYIVWPCQRNNENIV